MSKNVIKNVICSMAQVVSETEKAYKVNYSVVLYGRDFVIKNQWFPKSQLDVKKNENGVIWFVVKNNWLLDAKTRDYCKFIAENFSNVTHEIRTYLSNINTEKVTQVSC